MPMSNSRLSISFLPLLLLAACKTIPGGGPVGVAYAPATTIEGANNQADVELVGRKRVGLTFTMSAPTTIKSVVLAHWRAGNNAGSQSQTVTVNQSFTGSAQAPIVHTVFVEIPGAAQFEQCEGLYYTFGATYQVEGQPTLSSFFGQSHLILPTKKRVGNTIETALCAAPPPPGA